MKKSLFSVLGLLLATLTASPMMAQAQPAKANLPMPTEPFILFGLKRTIRIPYSKCNSDLARHGVRVNKATGGSEHIHWRWDNKRASWCGWGIQDIQNKDFTHYAKEFSLEVKLKGSWSDRAPEIKFMDTNNKSTKLVPIESFINGNPASEKGAIVKIPLAVFDMDWSIDIKNVHTLQFDAAYESANGDIKIESIAITK